MSGLTEKMRAEIIELLPRYPRKQAVTLPALHIVQEEKRCVPRAAVEEIADLLELSPAEVHDTLSFYGFFRSERTPLGKHRLWVCRSLSCMLRGGEELLVEICEKLGVKPGETTADGNVTVEFAECLGMCEGAPCLLMDDECHGNMTLDKTLDVIKSKGGTNGHV
jgi:NADH-quinone oxidoreductase subunit E